MLFEDFLDPYDDLSSPITDRQTDRQINTCRQTDRSIRVDRQTDQYV